MRTPKYMIGTGWWCEEDPTYDSNRKILGSEHIRSKDFHKLWYASVCTFTDPQAILIVDSASPVKPEYSRTDPRIKYVDMTENFGHSVHTVGKYSGWTRAAMIGLSYCFYNDIEYFVYVEQDALLFGRGIIERAIAEMRTGYCVGAGAGTWQPLQQSFFIVHRSKILRFMTEVDRFEETDQIIGPEVKFFWAPFRLPKFLRETRAAASYRARRRHKRIDFLPFGYGRTRPIDWTEPHFYFQHGEIGEIRRYCELTGFDMAWVVGEE